MRDLAAFVRAHTVVAPVALVPELRAHLATELTPLWTATEQFLRVHDIEPPYWAFAWPGSQALARAFLDGRLAVRGRRVLDVAAGGGVAAVAAMRAGAARVIANEVDPVAGAAIALNAALNGVAVEVDVGDRTGGAVPEVDLVVAGDVCYSQPMVERLLPWLRRCVAAGVDVVIADPGRAYVPAARVEELAAVEVPTLLELEDRPTRVTRLIRLVA